MATPIAFSVLTTMVAFAPLLYVPGRIGKIQFAIPIIVILVLGFSLIESFFILPAHLAQTSMIRQEGVKGGITRLQNKVSSGFERFIEHFYRSVVLWAVHNRWLTLAGSLSILMIVAGLLTGGYIKYIDFPGGDIDEVQAQAVLPYGVDVSETEAVTNRLIASARRALDKMGAGSKSLGILSTIGIGRHDSKIGSHITSVTVLLVPLQDRDFSSEQVARFWRSELGTLPQVESLGFSSTRHGLNKPIDFIVAHADIPTLEQISRLVVERLSSFRGVKDVDDGIAEGKPQWNFTLTEEGANAGLTVSDIGSQLRSSFYGAEALRQQRDRNEVKVMVRLSQPERESLETVEQFLLRTPDGGEIQLFQAAAVSKDYAYKSIVRSDGRRTLQIQADVDQRLANAKDIENVLFTSFLPELQQRFPGMEFGLRGRAEDFQGFRDFILLGITVALIAIFALIAVPLKSYLQPLFVVMAAIPFGFVGAVAAHFVLGMPLSMFSLMGILALAGVVVNDSIVYVTTANLYRQRGQGVIESAVNAACRRFRPIFLTTMTTFLGLSPIILETSPEAQMLIPMAVSIGFGILVSTIFVLLLVPALFVLTEQLRQLLSGQQGLAEQPMEDMR